MLKKCLVMIIIFGILSGTQVFAASDFADVPKDHWAYPDIMQMRDLKVTDGIGDNIFGLGKPITRGEFAAFLSKLLQWNEETDSEGSFSDNKDKSKWYFKPVEAAVKNGAVTTDIQAFRPIEPITREGMAVMLVRALGYEELAEQLVYLGSPFSDVVGNTGYITVAKEFGIISGTGENQFSPNATATREQAAAMMMRMYKGLNQKLTFKNGFYAIKSSQQKDLINSFDSTSFGWSRIEQDGGSLVLNTTAANINEFAVPSGFEEPLQMAKANGKSLLMVAVQDTNASDGTPLTGYVISEGSRRSNTVSSIVEAVNGISKDGMTASFDGVVIDFENLKGETLKQGFNQFLTELKEKLGDKLLYVAVHPKRREGHAYYDAYDYKTIGKLADKVILMAHDYNSKKLTASEMEQGIVMTPLAPIDEVFYSLAAIADPITGVEDKSKIVLQISFDTVQWKTRDGKTINETPYAPDYETLKNRMDGDVSIKYSKKHESPYVTFISTEDGTENVVWYEDTRSVAAKIKLAKMFGITGISYWRLGTIPDYKDSNKPLYLDVKGIVGVK